MKSYQILFYIVAIIAVVSATDYCAMNCTVDGREVKHIACGNDGSFARICLPDTKVVPITEDLKKVILHEHNLKRNLVAGGGNSTLELLPACRMATIQWDDELAKFAEMYAKVCEDIPQCHPTESFPNSGVAEDYQIHVVDNKFLNATEISELSIDVWFNTIVRENLAGDMLVDRNIRLGCAITAVMDKQLEIYYKKKILELHRTAVVCYYSTNVAEDTPLYEQCKKAAGSCKTDKNDEYPNLCSKKEIYE